jgi:hypothetical protein
MSGDERPRKGSQMGHAQVRGLTILASLLVALQVFAQTVFASTYAGYATYGAGFKGIQGWLRQDAVSPMTGDQTVSHWITVCGDGCNTWTQTGTQQGCYSGGCSENTPKIYLEYVDVCGGYHTELLSAPTYPTYFYRIVRVGGQYQYYCGGGIWRTAYLYGYYKGSTQGNAQEFATSYLGNDTGVVEALTERQNGAVVGPAYFGCSPTLNCSDTSYEMKVNYGGSWQPWTYSSYAFHADPPYLVTYHSFWAYQTCGLPWPSC